MCLALPMPVRTTSMAYCNRARLHAQHAGARLPCICMTATRTAYALPNHQSACVHRAMQAGGWYWAMRACCVEAAPLQLRWCGRQLAQQHVHLCPASAHTLVDLFAWGLHQVCVSSAGHQILKVYTALELSSSCAVARVDTKPQACGLVVRPAGK
jgi:hypothetical protein